MPEGTPESQATMALVEAIMASAEAATAAARRGRDPQVTATFAGAIRDLSEALAVMRTPASPTPDLLPAVVAPREVPWSRRAVALVRELRY